MTARLAAALASLALAVPAFADERIGTSRADAPNLEGAFVIHNPTDVTLKYQVRWGNGEWVHYTLAPNHRRTHSHKLSDQGKAPAPNVRFDNIGGDRRTTYETVHVAFGRVGYAGFGPVGYVNEAVDYDFRFARDGKRLDLYRR